ncbi:MAG: hypothetical protein VKJ04_08315 [Vampirovibrionales bacterium]|nr:hypothetical protein [Vampirovibrionales bacterium]
MSYLCYTLDEAAQQLGMSETVLFRLSQFLKIPEQAYDDVGYIAFNGDLSFSQDDISFFLQVKERLLKGETLENIRQRLRSDDHKPPEYPKATLSSAVQAQHQPIQHPIHPLTPQPQTLHTIESDAPLRQEAEKSFHHYKAKNRAGFNRVFENIADQITRGVHQITNSSIADIAFATPKPVGLRKFTAETTEAFKPNRPSPSNAYQKPQSPGALTQAPPRAKTPASNNSPQQAEISSQPIAASRITTDYQAPIASVTQRTNTTGTSHFALNFQAASSQGISAISDSFFASQPVNSQLEAPRGFQPISASQRPSAFASVPASTNKIPQEAVPQALRRPVESLQSQTERPAPKSVANIASLSNLLRSGPVQSSGRDWDDEPWLGMIQSSLAQPRAMNVRLRSAASLIRQKALHQYNDTQATSPVRGQ